MKQLTSKLYVVYGVLGLASFTLAAILFLLHTARPVEASTTRAEPDAPGSISGHVTDRQGNPIEGISVDLYNPEQWYPIRTVLTNQSGYYKFQIVAPGEYRVGFQDEPTLRYLPQFYKDAAQFESAANILVVGNQVDNVDATLTQYSIITGIVSGIDLTSTESMSLFVSAYKWSVTPYPQWYRTSAPLPLDTTGTYKINGLTTGIYRVCAMLVSSDSLNPLVDCYGNGSHVEAAQDIVVGQESTVSGIDILFTDGSDYATIAGRVIESSGKPISNTAVYISQATWQGGDFWYNYATTTDEQGRYKVDTLVSGVITYLVFFRDNAQTYVSEYYSHTLTRDNARLLAPHAHEVLSEVNAVLEAASQITGIVTLQGEIPSQDGHAYLMHKIDGYWQYYEGADISRGTGQYELVGLAAGTYRVCASFWLGNSTLGECLGGGDAISATDFVLGVGEMRTNVNFDVHTNSYEGRIRGKVEGNSIPLQGIQVNLLFNSSNTANSCSPDGTPVQKADCLGPGSTDVKTEVNAVYTYTDEQGKYTFEGLPYNDYRLLFTDPLAVYATSYYNESTIHYASSYVHIQSDTPHQNINVSLEKAGAISGTIRLANSQPVSGVVVTLNWNDGRFWNSVPFTFQTNERGEYVAKGIIPDLYHLYFYSTNPPSPDLEWVGEYYGPSADSLDNAADVLVTPGKTTRNIDLILGPDGLLWLPLVRKEN